MKDIFYDNPYTSIIGDFCNRRLSLYVRTDDKVEFPVMRIFGRDINDKIFMTSIRLDKAEYYFKPKKEDKLSLRQKEELINFLKSKHKYLPLTNWEYLKEVWNTNNPENAINYNLRMPDYTKL